MRATSGSGRFPSNPEGRGFANRLTTEAGVPVRFLIQLEYSVNVEGGWGGSDDWRIVARFDHDTSGPPNGNVELVGLHLDVYDPQGRQRWKKDDFPPIELREAMKRAEQYSIREHERLIRRYERWM